MKKLARLVRIGTMLLALTFAGAAPPAAAQIDVVQSSRDEAPRKLTDDEVNRWMSSFGGLLKLSRSAQAQLPEDGDSEASEAIAEQTRAQMLSVLDADGFDEATFSNVHFNVVRAWTAKQLRAQSGEIEAEQKVQREQLEAARESMTPEQYATAKQGLDAFGNTLANYQDVPEGNIELVSQHADEITALLSPP